MSKNAKAEFIEHVAGRVVVCAYVTIGNEWRDQQFKHLLRKGYTEFDLSVFLGGLDTQYHSGFGSQELFGTIWYADGTWSERGEYDGSEWWEHRECPAIPEELAP